MTFKPTLEQQEIVDAARSTDDNLLISALAGAAKTSTLVLVAEALPDQPMLCLAFNVKIAKEMTDRLPPHCLARTLNSLGHRTWSAAIGKRLIVEPKKVFNILSALIKSLPTRDQDQAWEQFSDTLAAINQSKICGYVPTGRFDRGKPLHTDDDFFEMLDFIPSAQQCGLIREAVVRSIEQAYDGIVDYNDQLFMPTIFPAMFDHYPHVLVDELQDLSELNHAMLRKLVKKRITGVGDDCQCQPAGTMIRTKTGTQPIETLEPGHEVLSYHRDSPQLRTRKVLQTASRHFIGELIGVGARAAAVGYEATPNHRCLVRLTSERLFTVYLMRKRGQYRIGRVQLASQHDAFGPGLRGRQEKADAVWLLTAFKAEAEAKLCEQQLIEAFEIPGKCFIHPSKTLLDQQEIDAFWLSVGDNTDKALKVLKTFERELEYPIWKGFGVNQISRRQCLVRACNLHPLVFEVPVADEATGKEADVYWHALTLRRRHFEGIVYSLEVERTQSTNYNGLYISGGIITGNSIYAFRGAHQGSMLRMRDMFDMRELQLSISFRCPRRVVREAQWRAPHMKWPDWAIEGHVSELETWSADRLPNAGESVAILCRNNAPLFSVAIRLLKNGRRCQIAGTDIGKGLLTVMKKLGQGKMPQKDVFTAIEDWKAAKLDTSRTPDKIFDQADCFRVFAERGKTLDEAIAYAKFIFDQAGPIQMMTIHKSKGLEYDHIFLMDRQLIRTRPRTPEQTQWLNSMTMEKVPERDTEQEKNLLYVAQTRAKKSLTYVTSASFGGE